MNHFLLARLTTWEAIELQSLVHPQLAPSPISKANMTFLELPETDSLLLENSVSSQNNLEDVNGLGKRDGADIGETIRYVFNDDPHHVGVAAQLLLLAALKRVDLHQVRARPLAHQDAGSFFGSLWQAGKISVSQHATALV